MTPELYNEVECKARKSYLCVECNGLIVKGELYFTCRGKWDGDFRSYRFCSACHELIEECFDDGADPELLCIGDLRDYLVNNLTDKRMSKERNRLARFKVNVRKRKLSR